MYTDRPWVGVPEPISSIDLCNSATHVCTNLIKNDERVIIPLVAAHSVISRNHFVISHCCLVLVGFPSLFQCRTLCCMPRRYPLTWMAWKSFELDWMGTIWYVCVRLYNQLNWKVSELKCHSISFRPNGILIALHSAQLLFSTHSRGQQGKVTFFILPIPFVTNSAALLWRRFNFTL